MLNASPENAFAQKPDCVRVSTRQAMHWAFLFLSPLIMLGQITQPAQTTGTFYGAGLNLLPQSSPKPTGWAVVALLASSTAKVWSISGIDFTANGKPIMIHTSAWTGAATSLRDFGDVKTFILAGAAATTNRTNSGGGIVTGAFATIPLKNLRIDGVMVIIGYRMIKTSIGDSQQLVELGIGRTQK